MNWTILTALSSWIPTTAVVGFLLQYQKRSLDRSLEKIKRELQTDVVRFSRWHEKRVTALEVIYQAFARHLDFLRRKFYFDSDEPIDSIHEFRNALQAQMLYLDAATAAKISIYQRELIQFWNQATLSKSDAVGMAQIRDRLDHEIPGYLLKLQRDINQALDPDYDPERDKVRNAGIDFYFADRRASSPS